MKKILSGILLCALCVGAAFAAMSDKDFIELCETGTLKQVEAAIKDGADVNADLYGQSPLMCAAESNPNPKVIIALINAGADVNAKDYNDRRAIIYAKRNKDIVDTAAYQKLKEATIAALGNDFLTLCRIASPQQVEAAIKAGVDIHAKDENDRTPLMGATDNSNPEVIIVLIKAGADVHAKDKRGKRAIDYAKDNKNIVNTDAYRQLEAASK